MQNSAYQTPGHDEIRLCQKSDLRDKKGVRDMILYKRHKIILDVIFVIIHKFIPNMIFNQVKIIYSLYDSDTSLIFNSWSKSWTDH